MSYENAVELTEIILDYFGLNTGLFSKITSAIQLGKSIAEENKQTEKQQFIQTLENSIQSFLSGENVTEDVIEKLKDTFQNHFDLQEFMHHFGNHEDFCSLLAKTQYSETEQRSDSSFSAYFTALNGIVEALYDHLALFEVGTPTDIAILQKLWDYDAMCKLYDNILNENRYLFQYTGSFAEYIDNAKLPPNVYQNKFDYRNPNIGFHGRENECAAIQTFLTQSQHISIWAITGPGGIGKSKLARHIAETYQYHMGVVWLTEDDFTKISTIITAKNSDYDRPILFICDYASTKETELNHLIKTMAKTTYNVQFLLLERSAAWYYRFLNMYTYAEEYKYKQGMDDAAPIDLSDSAFNPDDYYGILDDFSRANYQKSIPKEDKKKIVAYTQRLSNNSTQRAKSARCLFLLLAADAYLTNTSTHTLQSWDESALLKNYIQRSKRMIQDKYSKHIMNAAFRILALATAFGGLNLEKTYSTEIQKQIHAITEELDDDCSAVSELFSAISETTVESMTAEPLFPDIVGEFLFVTELQSLSQKAKQEWFTMIYENEYGKTFLSRCIADWNMKNNAVQKYIVENESIDRARSAEILCNAILELNEFEKAQNILESMEKLPFEKTGILEQYTLAIRHMMEIAEYKEQRMSCLARIEQITANEMILEESDSATTTFHNIAKGYCEMGHYEKALLYYQKAMTICEKIFGTEHSDTAVIYNNIAGVYENKGNYDTALEFYQKALAISEKVLSTEHPSTAATYNNIAGIYRAKSDYDKALEFYQKALLIKERVLSTEHPSTATTYNNIAGVYKDKGNYDTALEFYQKTLSIIEKVLGTEHPNTAATYNNIAEIYRAKSDYDKALKFYQKALSNREKVLGTEHPSTAATYNNIAGVYEDKGDFDAALEFYQKSLAIMEKVFDTEHPDTATTYNNIAGVYGNKGNYDTALKFYQKAISIREKVLGTEHPSTATTYNNIAGVYKDKGNFDIALEFYQKDLAISEKVLGTEHPSTATTYNNIAGVYKDKGNFDMALEFYQKALSIREKVLGTEHPSTATTYNNIAGVYENKGNFDMALEFYQKDLAISEKVLGTEHPFTATTYNNIAGVYEDKGDFGMALEFYQKAISIKEKVLGTEHPDTATTYNNIAGVYRAKSDYNTALEFYQKALSIREKALGTEHPDTAATYNNIAGVYEDKGDFDTALEFYQKALSIKERVLDKGHLSTATTHLNIGVLYLELKDYSTALTYFQQAYAVFLEKLGKDHPNTKIAMKWLEATEELFEPASPI